jgi:hypothetical protein
METMDTSSNDMELTFGMVARVLKLSKLQIRAVFGLIQKPQPADEDIISRRDLRHLLLADLLENIKFLRPEQRTVILDGVWATTAEHADIPVCCVGDQIVFADSRYCTWSGNTGWLDLLEGENTAELPCPPLETIAYNLIELERQAKNAIENRSGANAKRNAGSVEEPGYVRVGPTDAVYGQVRDRGADVGTEHDPA